jgi:hypothetical protein
MNIYINEYFKTNLKNLELKLIFKNQIYKFIFLIKKSEWINIPKLFFNQS